MSYDYWGSWSSNIGCNSPLYGRRDMSANDKLLNTVLFLVTDDNPISGLVGCSLG